MRKIVTGMQTGETEQAPRQEYACAKASGQEDRKSVDETDIKGYSRSNSNSKRNINFSGWQR